MTTKQRPILWRRSLNVVEIPGRKRNRSFSPEYVVKLNLVLTWNLKSSTIINNQWLPAATAMLLISFTLWVCVCVLETPTVVGTTTEPVYFARYMFVVRFCNRDNVIAMQDSVTKLYKCVLRIKMKTKFKKCVWSEQQPWLPHFTLLAWQPCKIHSVGE